MTDTKNATSNAALKVAGKDPTISEDFKSAVSKSDVETCDLPWLDDQVTFHLFSNSRDTDVSKPRTYSYRELLRHVFGKHRGQAEKDGPCVVGGEFLSPAGGRKDANVKSVSFVQLDFDNSKIEGRQTKPDDIGNVWMKRRGFGGQIYTTFSLTGELMKFRVLLPLKKPFVIRESADDPNGSARDALFKRTLKHLADDTGEPYDISCVNAARIFYTPAYNLNDPDAEGLCYSEFIPGDAVDFDKLAENLPPDPEKVKKTGKKQNSKGKRNAVGGDDGFQTPGLAKFLAKFAAAFEFEDFLSAHEYADRGRGTTGTTFECPNADEHTPDKSNDWRFGFWAQNASERDNGFGCACSHGHCKDYDRAWFLDMACVQSEIEHAKKLLAWCPGHETDDWDDTAFDFVRGENGRPVANKLTNSVVGIRRCGVTFKKNLFSQRIFVEGLDGCALRLVRDEDISQLIENCERFEGRDAFTPTSEAMKNAMINEGRRNAWHPVRDYLDGVTWDGVPRIGTWLHTYLQAQDTPLNGEFGKRWLIAAVARVFQPGAKFDQCLLLISEQGTGKSTAFNILATCDEWFTDGLDIDSDPKTAIEQSGGKWIVELAELAGMRKADVDRVKAFLSRRVDTARMSYGRVTEDVPRQFICAATTNNETPLKDETGNRRFWPAAVGKTKEAELRRDVSQLWAEAVSLYRAGEGWALPQTFYNAAAEVQGARQQKNQFLERLEDKLSDFASGRLASSNAYLLAGLGEGQRDTYKQSEVIRALAALGWVKKDKVDIGDGKRVNGFERGQRGPLIIAQLDPVTRTYDAFAEDGFTDAIKQAAAGE